jgi:hypothetical protein
LNRRPADYEGARSPSEDIRTVFSRYAKSLSTLSIRRHCRLAPGYQWGYQLLSPRLAARGESLKPYRHDASARRGARYRTAPSRRRTMGRRARTLVPGELLRGIVALDLLGRDEKWIRHVLSFRYCRRGGHGTAARSNSHEGQSVRSPRRARRHAPTGEC